MDLQEENNDTDIDVDSLLESIETTGSVPPASEPAKTPEAPAVQEFEYDWRGQKVKEPIETILKRASMGRDYNHLVEEHKTQKSQWEKERSTWETEAKPYKEIDQFIKSGDEGAKWWQHVQESYQQRGQSQVDPALQPYLEKIQQIEQKLSVFDQREQEEVIKKEDGEFNAEVQGIREKYSDLPWEVPGSDGKSLMFKVLEHGTQNGIKSFKTAFLDFYHDELAKRWESRGREAVTKETQKRTKLGLLGETQAPKKGISSAQNIKNRSYDDLTREALEELGIS